MQNMIILRGPIGSGKTSLMHELRRQLIDCSAIELDALKRMADPSASSPWRRKVALETGVFLAGQLLRSGRSVVVETHTRWREQAERFRQATLGLPAVLFNNFLVLAPYEVCLARATARQVPGITYPIDEEMVSAYYVNLEPLPGEQLIDTTLYSPATAARHIIQTVLEKDNMKEQTCVE